MESIKWKKIEDEDGYPCYIDETTGKQQHDHPEFLEILEKLKLYDGIKYGAYRIAFKIYELQKRLKVPCLRISLGVFRVHQLSLSESSLSLDMTGLENVLDDIYFAAKKDKETQFSGDVNLTVDLIINLLLNVHDKERKEPIRVLAVKTLLIILSEESASAKWAALATCAADHNGCVSHKRLAALLSHVTALPAYLGSTTTQLQEDVDACFEKNAGMVGVSTRAVAEWGGNSSSSRWLPVVDRVAASRQMTTATDACSNCHKPLVQMLKFQCMKCNEVYFCEKCYLYEAEAGAGSTVRGHKNTHLVQEVIDGQSKIPQCVSLMRGMKRFFFCSKRKKRTNVKVSAHRPHSPRRRPGIVSSTVGKAEGHREATPTAVLQDIINQLETQDKVLRELSEQLKASDDANLKVKVEDHWSHISRQIKRLKTLKSTLPSQADLPTESNPKPDRPQAFDLFSPIPVVAKQSRVADKQTRVADKQTKVADKQSKVAGVFSNQPRVRSLDSGNFSVLSRSGSQHLLTVSGDALRPVLQTSDTISTVSMNDISTWYNEQISTASYKRQGQPSSLQPAVTVEVNPESTTSDPTDWGPAIPSGPADRVDACPARAGPTDRTEAFTPGPTDRIAACEDKILSVEHSMQEVSADLDTVLDRLHQLLANNFAMDESSFDNSQLRETASEMEGLLGTLIRGVEQRATLHARATTSRGLL